MGREESETVKMENSCKNFAPKGSMEVGLCEEGVEK